MGVVVVVVVLVVSTPPPARKTINTMIIRADRQLVCLFDDLYLNVPMDKHVVHADTDKRRHIRPNCFLQSGFILGDTHRTMGV